jgi:hypothetical protein
MISRLCAAGGGIYVVLALVGESISGSGSWPTQTDSRPKIAHWLLGQQLGTKHYLGLSLEVLGMCGLIAFAGYLWTSFGRRDDDRSLLGVTAAAALLVGIAIKLSSIPAVLALEWRAGQGFDPQIAALLIDVGSFAFLLTWVVWSVTLLALGVLILRSRTLPSWLGAVGVGLAPLALVSVAAADHLPPFALLLGLVWIGFVSARFSWRASSAGPAVSAAQGAAG